MLRPVAPDPELIAWLWSIEGLLWHKKNIHRVNHAAGYFAEVKNDHECGDICNASGYSPYSDGFIFDELRRFGISGVPREWKTR